jgi:hypothetical protein
VKGVARTILQLLYVSWLQGWLLGIGLMLTLFGIGAQAANWHPAAQPLFAIAAILGIVCTVVAPIVVGGILFRSLSAPRCVQLIPYARVKLALGAFCTQLLLALFSAVTVGTMLLFRIGPYNAPPAGSTAAGLIATVFALVLSGLTLFFLTIYWGLQFRRGPLFLFLAYIILPQLLPRAFPHLHLGALLVTPTGLGAVSTISLLAWLVFVATYVRARHINLPQWNMIGVGASSSRAVADSTASYSFSAEPLQHSQSAALRILLTGIVNIRWRIWTFVVIFLAFIAAMLLIVGGKVPGGNAPISVVPICAFSGLFPSVLSGLMTSRARFLWLTAGLGRAELFTAVEMQSWRMILIVAAIAMAFALPVLAFSIHAHPTNARFVTLLTMPVVTGAMLVYVAMLYVRGRRRITDNLIVAGCAAVVFAEIVSALTDVGPMVVLAALLGAQVILVPLLRRLAQRRWQNIDWIINRPIQPATKLM